MDNANSTEEPTSSRKPLIGLTGRRKQAVHVDGFPDNLDKQDVDLYLADYARSVLAAGGLPMHLPMDADPIEYLDHIDGVLLTGGADIDPSSYGQVPDGNGHYEADRDALELPLIGASVERGVPLLGICRGLQAINIHAGGTLNQDVHGHATYHVGPHTRVHDITFDPRTRLGLLYDGLRGAQGESHMVNSLHHQTVDRLGHGLKVSARSNDGVVEGLEMPGHDLLGVQWHPEMTLEPEPVFDWLISRATSHMARTGATNNTARTGATNNTARRGATDDTARRS